MAFDYEPFDEMVKLNVSESKEKSKETPQPVTHRQIAESLRHTINVCTSAITPCVRNKLYSRAQDLILRVQNFQKLLDMFLHLTEGEDE